MCGCRAARTSRGLSQPGPGGGLPSPGTEKARQPGDLGGGIAAVCDAGCATSLPGVVAVGDVARTAGVRAAHWTGATEQPAVAVRNLLAGRTVEHCRGVPYFWSDQYGTRIQFAGRALPTDIPHIAEGDVDAGSFLAIYERDGRITAVLAVNRPRPFTRLRRELARAAAPVR